MLIVPLASCWVHSLLSLSNLYHSYDFLIWLPNYWGQSNLDFWLRDLDSYSQLLIGCLTGMSHRLNQIQHVEIWNHLSPPPSPNFCHFCQIGYSSNNSYLEKQTHNFFENLGNYFDSSLSVTLMATYPISFPMSFKSVPSSPSILEML